MNFEAGIRSAIGLGAWLPTFARNSWQKTTKKREKRRFREMIPGLGSAI